jgi:hypothetical protein
MAAKSSKKAVAQADAETLIKQLRAMQNSVPGFEVLKVGQRRALGPAANASNDFLLATAAAVDASPALAAATQLDPPSIHDVITFDEGFSQLADEAEALARGIRHTIAIRRAKVGEQSLQAYSIAQGLARSNGDLRLHVADVKSKLGRGRRKPSAAPKPPTA